MSTITRTLVLVGAYEGKTIALKAGDNTYEFTDGKMEVSGPSADVDNLSKYLERCYQAYPEGSKELEAARARIKEADDGSGEADPDETGAGNEHEGGTNDAEGGAGQDAQEQPEAGDGDGDAEPEAGEAGAADAEGDSESPIAVALRKLDPENDDQWTADGKPKMAAVEAVLGRSDVTRADVDAALPGFDREAARG